MTQATMDARSIRQTLLANRNFDPVEVAAVHDATSSGAGAGGEDAPARLSGGFLSRPHVLEAAAACFNERGYDKLTIRTIAGRLGCSVGSIYRYFTDKRELLLACCSQVLEPVADTLESGDVSFDDSVALYVRQAGAMNEQYRLMFWLCPAPGSLPVIERILAAWAALLGDAGEARRRWAQLHGLLIIGEDVGSIGKAAIREVAPAVAPAPLTPALSHPRNEEREQDPPRSDADDVTLL